MILRRQILGAKATPSTVNLTPARVSAASIAAKLLAMGAVLLASKSFTVLKPTLASLARRDWVQFSKARAARLCAGVIMAVNLR